MPNYRPGDRVVIHKNGNYYPGKVISVARTGTLKVEFTPKNGNKKTTHVKMSY